MKAITLYQPYAHMMEVRAKRNETRSWSTEYRGPLAIHAAKTRKFNTLFEIEPFLGFKSMFTAARFGEIVCVVNVVDVLPVWKAVELLEAVTPHNSELLLGDYTDGRYAWLTDYICPIKDLGQVRGYQGLWNLPAEIETQVRAQMAAHGFNQ